MMLYPSMPELLRNIDNQYLLVNVASKRAREVAQTAMDNGERLQEKPVKIAIIEIARGKLSGSLKEGRMSSADM